MTEAHRLVLKALARQPLGWHGVAHVLAFAGFVDVNPLALLRKLVELDRVVETTPGVWALAETASAAAP